VEIVVSTYHLGLGGTESYTLTVAEQLQRLGHDVTVFYVELGPGVDIGRQFGLELRNREDDLPVTCDVVFAQESITSYQLADRYPTTPQAFAVHADEYDLSVPPQLPGVVQALVVLNDRIERQVRALALTPEIVRLRQPVDTKRFYPRTALNDPPKRALLLGNYVDLDRRDLLMQACHASGIELQHLGATSGKWATQPELELCGADIVIGKARVIVEAMASGRAAYVYDHNGGDGWVTPERYLLLESDNFGGQAEPTARNLEGLRADLAAYSPEPRERVDAPLREMSRLARLQWTSEGRAMGFAAEIVRLRAELDRANAELARRQARPVRRAVRSVVRRLGPRKDQSAQSV